MQKRTVVAKNLPAIQWLSYLTFKCVVLIKLIANVQEVNMTFRTPPHETARKPTNVWSKVMWAVHILVKFYCFMSLAIARGQTHRSLPHWVCVTFYTLDNVQCDSAKNASNAYHRYRIFFVSANTSDVTRCAKTRAIHSQTTHELINVARETTDRRVKRE